LVEMGQLLVSLDDRALLRQRQDLQAMQQLWQKEVRLLGRELGLLGPGLARATDRREWSVETGGNRPA
jgi:hypothetical protein